jgi:hypothetical protein
MEISGVSPEVVVMATSAQGREIKRQAAVMNGAQQAERVRLNRRIRHSQTGVWSP